MKNLAFFASNVRDVKSGKELTMYSLRPGNDYFVNFLLKYSPYLVSVIDFKYSTANSMDIIDIEIFRKDLEKVEHSFSQFNIIFEKSDFTLQELLYGEMSLPCNGNLIIEWILQIISGVKSLHDQGYVHRNIKPIHIHIYSNNYGKYVKIGGTWSSCPIGYEAEPYIPELEYKAPELDGKEEMFTHLPSLDIYNLAVIISILMKYLSVSDTRKKKIDVFLKQMKRTNPVERPDIYECYQFFRDAFYPNHSIPNKLFDCSIFCCDP